MRAVTTRGHVLPSTCNPAGQPPESPALLPGPDMSTTGRRSTHHEEDDERRQDRGHEAEMVSWRGGGPLGRSDGEVEKGAAHATTTLACMSFGPDLAAGGLLLPLKLLLEPAARARSSRATWPPPDQAAELLGLEGERPRRQRRDVRPVRGDLMVPPRPWGDLRSRPPMCRWPLTLPPCRTDGIPSATPTGSPTELDDMSIRAGRGERCAWLSRRGPRRAPAG